MQPPAYSAKELRRVVIAALVGNVIEWYDVYIFGSLAAILAQQFFSKTHPIAAFLSTVALFTVGFLTARWARSCSVGWAISSAGSTPSC